MQIFIATSAWSWLQRCKGARRSLSTCAKPCKRPPHPWLDLPPGLCLRAVPLSCIVCRHRGHDLICRIRIFIGVS
ncbi:unnamed protein product [Symbiodinium necroappetens]|uniref:Uncharacterized protein n=1 Tax=Symbiodinium necroappetens TaxID=1628268 RepID=A0A812TT35_9DINO|nr:unnamed protein product [Symbiodinium necroappetens]